MVSGFNCPICSRSYSKTPSLLTRSTYFRRNGCLFEPYLIVEVKRLTWIDCKVSKFIMFIYYVKLYYLRSKVVRPKGHWISFMRLNKVRKRIPVYRLRVLIRLLGVSCQSLYVRILNYSRGVKHIKELHKDKSQGNK